MTYTYDAAGHVASIKSSNTNGAKVSYTYDPQNRLSSVTDIVRATTTNYTYDLASNVATVQYPNLLTSTFTYDTQNRLTELSTPPVADYRYTLGPTGIRSQVVEQGGRTVVWGYDGIYRLKNEAVTSDPNVDGTVAYVLDPVGNRNSDTSSLSGVTPGSFGPYNPNDQMPSETYDPNGNTLTTGASSFTYDSQNRMQTMTGNGQTVSMVYDAFGNRVAKTVNGVTTQYLVDDLNPTGYPQVIEELSGPIIGSGTVQRVYTYGLQRISEDLSPVLTGNSTWTPSYYGYDGGGTVRYLTNSGGTQTDTYDYDAFGNLVHKTGTTPNNYLYRGEQYDADLGLYYLRARYYNPATGRFLSRDPEDGKPWDPKTLHKYLYAGGDPVNFVDPVGREEAEEPILSGYEVGRWTYMEAKEFVLGPVACSLGIHATILAVWGGGNAIDNTLGALGLVIGCGGMLLP